MNTKKREFGLIIIFLFLAISIQAAVLRGSVTDKVTNEPLIGAVIQISGTTTGAITDLDGNFELAGLRNGTYKLMVSYVSYKTLTLEVSVNGMSEINITLAPDNQQLGEVVVVAEAKKNTENALITRQRTSLVMQTGVSAQQITKTQDKDASEVIRRVPGISIIEEKFVMVRGATLQQCVDKQQCRAQFGSRRTRLLLRYHSFLTTGQYAGCKISGSRISCRFQWRLYFS
jgi:hypothetical protein